MQQPPEGNYQNPPSQPPYQQPTQPPYNPQQTPVPPPPYQYGNYPPQQAPIKPRKSRTWLWIVGLILAFLVGRASVTASSTTDATPQTSTANTTTNQQQVVQPTQAPTKPQKPLVWTTTQSFTGNGSKKTGTFSAPDDWKITWSCNPASSYGGSYNMIVSVYNSDATPADIGAINSTCQAGSIKGETEEHQAGTVYLDITSEGSWNITVQELK